MRLHRTLNTVYLHIYTRTHTHTLYPFIRTLTHTIYPHTHSYTRTYTQARTLYIHTHTHNPYQYARRLCVVHYTTYILRLRTLHYVQYSLLFFVTYFVHSTAYMLSLVYSVSLGGLVLRDDDFTWLVVDTREGETSGDICGERWWEHGGERCEKRRLVGRCQEKKTKNQKITLVL